MNCNCPCLIGSSRKIVEFLGMLYLAELQEKSLLYLYIQVLQNCTYLHHGAGILQDRYKGILTVFRKSHSYVYSLQHDWLQRLGSKMSENTKWSRAYNFAVHFEMNKYNVTLSHPSKYHWLHKFGFRTWLGRVIP